MSKKILVADDSVVIQKSIGITFAQEDFQVTFVGNGEEALQRAKEIKPDMILADTSMPKLSGVDLCKKIRLDADFAKTPIILLSNFQETFTEAELKTCGANDFIQKPFESTALLEKIRICFNPITSTKLEVTSSGWDSAIAQPNPFQNSVGAEEDTAVAFQIHQASKTNNPLNSNLPAQDDDHSTLKSFNENIDQPIQNTVANLDMLSIDDDEDDSDEQNKVAEFASFEAEPLSSTSLTSASPSMTQKPTISETPQLQLSDIQIEQIVAKVFQNVIEKIAWEVVPELAERIIKEEIKKISQDT